ncbi:MAG: 30S ribosomal protein S9 [Candidatus Campbellbacteria bacterium]|nr:30S ribosomal protein S9 [Candidatus Campbellbacteria bacterium]
MATKTETTKKKDTRYIETIGRRKEAHARVRVIPNHKGTITVNDRPYKEFFPVPDLYHSVTDPLTVVEMKEASITAKVAGGGIRAQAEAIRLGVARALLRFNPEFRAALKAAGYLRRDARKVERKKPGLRKARRAPQWSKR